LRAIRLFLLLSLVAFSPLALDSQEKSMPSSTAMTSSAGTPPVWIRDSVQKLERELTAKYGEPQRLHVQRGLRQVAGFWRTEDGDTATFEDFVRANFAGDQGTLEVPIRPLSTESGGAGRAHA
jgi:hypothetical protein